MLTIDPDECIDCAVCIPECPVNAILPEEDVPQRPAALHQAQRRAVAQAGPASPSARPPPPDADEWKDSKDKLDQLIR